MQKTGNEQAHVKADVGAQVVVEERARRLISQLAQELNIRPTQVKTTVQLLDEGNTIPFIARYRKEMTGELDETQLRDLSERLQYLRNLEARKDEVLRLIEEQGKLTDELRTAIEQAAKLQEVEDLYRPYRQKKKTRAGVAREKGLEPLAEWLLSLPMAGDALQEATAYVSEEKGVASAEEALQGAQDIIAETVADDAKTRAWVRRYMWREGLMASEAKDAEAESVYEMYYKYREPLRKLPPHRVLAMNRGEKEEFLKIRIELETRAVFEFLAKQWMKRPTIVAELLAATFEDSYKRLLAPSLERELRNQLTEQAEEHAIAIFSENLRQLLLQPPVKGYVVLGVDPAFRTGCKLAVVDETGKLLDIAVTYPTPPLSKVAEAEATFTALIRKHGVQLIVIGNGTASRETEQFVAGLIAKLQQELKYIIVSESGASVYSASRLAQEEFPTLDVAERSAISIARRLQDPLAELVKIEPKAIGVGQYQHDVAAKRLEDKLGAVVESAVNHVGVDLNTASPSLLSYVAGVNMTIAKQIVKYREEQGKFKNRKQLQKVPRLGPKTYEQCVGFMRISDGDNPLDNTPIHPESYAVVDRLQMLVGGAAGRAQGKAQAHEQLRALDVERAAQELGVGVPTLRDIVDSLQRPGRDPREELAPPIFHTEVLQIEDLQVGMQLQGTVRNVVDFGAFVDIGIKNDGLVHISQLADKFVKHPLEVVGVGDIVTVWVLSVDLKKGRVGLTMRAGG